MDNNLLDELLQQYDAEKKKNNEDRKNKKEKGTEQPIIGGRHGCEKRLMILR